jgi:membrane-bound metal-dependent hydrolase YbcI (DUF457 family)
MPSPIGHALAGFAAGWLAAPVAAAAQAFSKPVQPPVAVRQTLLRWRWPLAFAAVGVAADLDLLAGLHSRYTHSVGAALLVFAGAWLLLRRRAADAPATALALALSYSSHILLDWLGSDTTPPLGIMALWPFSDAFYLSPVPVFMGISRKYWLAVAWTQNAESVLRELLILVPVAAATAWIRRVGCRYTGARLS